LDKNLDDRALGHVAEYFQALSEPLRLKLLNVLREGPRNVNQLTERLACSQANVSKHLGVLARLGFVARDAKGTAAFYRIADPAVYELCDLVCGRIATRFQSQAALLGALAAPARRARPAARVAPPRAASARGAAR
jgi:DNA-binding transcriptional ArsR family regulator